tara:strand:+ start:311 stop:1408 length:1098 start_codon:yes stop_codon:yes gene_type:complete
MGKKIVAGIVGAGGYTGGEVCRLLLNHPKINNIFPFSRVDQSFEQVHPNLFGTNLKFFNTKTLTEIVENIDVLFFCTPSGTAMETVPKIIDKDVKIIDLSADFRFHDTKLYYDTYGIDHKCKNILQTAIYGLTELNRDQIKKAKLIANPGCYVITCILGIYPLLMEKVVDLNNFININSINGTTGAGVKPKKDLMFTEMLNNMLPYNLEGHRHGPELESQLSNISSKNTKVVFNTAHGPYPRGIFSTISLGLNPKYNSGISREELIKIYHKYYGIGSDGEFFVRIVDYLKHGSKNEKLYHIYPQLRNVIGTNFCNIGLDYDDDRKIIKVISITDNLIKGAAGSAIQNMNVLYGFSENDGLTQLAL